MTSRRARNLWWAAAIAPALFLLACPHPQPKGDDAGPAAATSTSASVTKSLWDEKARSEAIAAGTAVIEKHQCTRCHTLDAQKPAARPLHCTSCHVWLKAMEPGKEEWNKLAGKYGADIITRYQRNIVHLQRVPDLTGLGKRVRADWIAAYLTEPHDLRPLLTESMFRHSMEPPEVRAVARYFAAVADAPDPWAQGYAAPAMPTKPADDRIARGKKLFAEKGCNGCHVLGNVQTGVTKEQLEAGKSLSLLAPNLRFVRERTRPEVVVDWIVDPKRIFPQTTMPTLGVSRDDAEAIRDFLFFADPELKPAKAVDTTPPKPVDRKVSYEEMKERVLGKVCVHCHMNDYEKDPGPGNLGGLGYKGVHLEMRTYETLVSGAVDDKGERYSVLVAKKGETVPPIVQAMLRRRVEGARDQVAAFDDHELPHYPQDKPGMPMGLPTMTDEEIGILEAWIAQGCVGPTKPSGMPGIDDGFLVPDGPIEKNQGCELRAPSKVRPAWAKETEAKHAKNAASKDPKSPASKPEHP